MVLLQPLYAGRHTGVAACRLSHARDLPTGWTSAAYDISLLTITKSEKEPAECAKLQTPHAGLAGSDKGHCVNFVGVDFAGVT